MFWITRDPLSGNSIQCLTKIMVMVQCLAKITVMILSSPLIWTQR